MWNTRQETSASPTAPDRATVVGTSRRAQAGQLDGEPGHQLPVAVVGGDQSVQDGMGHRLGVKDDAVFGPERACGRQAALTGEGQDYDQDETAGIAADQQRPR